MFVLKRFFEKKKLKKIDPSQKYLEDTVSSRERSKHKLLPPIQSPRKFDIEELGDICIDGSSISDYWDDETNEKKKKIVKLNIFN